MSGVLPGFCLRILLLSLGRERWYCGSFLTWTLTAPWTLLTIFYFDAFRRCSFFAIVFDRDLEIPDGELEVSTMRSGGSGGQNVNKVETGVRMKHIPTGIAVRCTQERSQMLNREMALKMLKEKLVVVMQEQQTKDLAEIRRVLECWICVARVGNHDAL